MCQPSANDLKANNDHQVEEALGDYNRYFANRHYGRKATDNGCVMYYVKNGGAEGHRKRVEEHTITLQ